jgi:hypothetical protein
MILSGRATLGQLKTGNPEPRYARPALLVHVFLQDAPICGGGQEPEELLRK